MFIQIIENKAKLASVYRCQRSFIVHGAERSNLFFLVFGVEAGRNFDYAAKKVVNDFPHLADSDVYADHISATLAELQIGDALRMVMLDAYIIVELRFVELNGIEDLLCEYKLLPKLQALLPICILELFLCTVFEFFQDSHAGFALAHRYQEKSVESLTLSRHIEDEF